MVLLAKHYRVISIILTKNMAGGVIWLVIIQTLITMYVINLFVVICTLVVGDCLSMHIVFHR